MQYRLTTIMPSEEQLSFCPASSRLRHAGPAVFSLLGKIVRINFTIKKRSWDSRAKEIEVDEKLMK